MITRQLGANGPIASAIGLGCMGMSDLYGASDRTEGVATIHAALDAGVTLLDTGDFYGMGDNEMLIAEALRGRPRDGVILSVKFGAQRDPDGNWIGFDGRPSAVKTALAYSLKRLGVDYLDIYRPARLDPNVPIEETVGAGADMVKAGYVRFIGLSEVGSETIRRAAAVHPIADLQIEYSLISRGIEKAILPTCRALGVGVTAYGVLSRGLISGHWQASAQTTKGDFRASIPRFQGENLGKNLALVEEITRIADARGATVAQVAIAWVLSRGDDIVPLIGARRRDRLAESLGALALTLDRENLAALENLASSVSGARYAKAQMAHLDSEGR
ncbi:aldo/keto reductase [Methylocystis sp.]|uniref:aldo/keto reductase n=1 Tax=Methylocystis sp. TaxID=1911079 RepID=UPI0027336CF1|nr:aldo/keto reductase [Methylocystis sp.]MDP3553925.1 aldo/keto reductase [Methylocystis sp.]